MHPRLEQHLTQKMPEGSTGLEVEIGGYLFGLADTGVTHRASIPLTFRYLTPKKTGGVKKVAKKTFIRASYCPFCGKSYDETAGELNA